MPDVVNLGGRHVGVGRPPLFVAEIGSNHNGDMDLCRRLIDAAVDAGADCVKFQAYIAANLLAAGEYAGQPELLGQVDRYRLGAAEHAEAKRHCEARDVLFCSTPFSIAEADMLENLGAAFFKIGSGEINHLPFLRHVARKRRPMIVSTGMATLAEIDRALETIRAEGNDQIVLLHCVSLYPPEFAAVNLRNIPMLSETFGVPVGFSDHTIGIGCPIAAVAVGACLIEKHFTLDKKMEGWDHAVSADPDEFATIVRQGRGVWQALGDAQRRLGSQEVAMRATFRRSLVTRRAMRAGELIAEADVDFKRPGTGIPPDQLSFVVGRRLLTNIEADHVLRWSHLE